MTASALNCDPTILRAVSPPEAPYRGVLVAGEPRRYLVASDDAPDGVWDAGDDHVLGACDLDRVGDRVMLVLPRLARRLPGDARGCLRAGQAVTLVVSVLRGGQRADELGIVHGDWWLTDDGRPVLAPGGDRDWRETARAVLDAARAVLELTGLVDRALATIARPEGYVRAAAAIEDDLFAAADPEALDDLGAPALAPDDGAWRSLVTGPEGRSTDGTGAVQREVTDAVTRMIDADVGRHVATAWQAVRAQLTRRGAKRPPRRRDSRRAEAPRRPTSPAEEVGEAPATETRRRPRRPVVLLACAVVAATLAIGLGWPSDTESAPPGAAADDSAAADTTDEPGDQRGTAPGVPSAPASTPAAGPVQPSTTATPNEAAIEALASCLASDEQSCRSDVLERPEAQLPPGVATSSGPRTVTELDDLGGVVVTRVEDPAGAQAPQIVVLVDTDDKRLVRDVYDVADQP